MSDFGHKLVAGLGQAAALVTMGVAAQYSGNWKVSLGCCAVLTVLASVGFVATKPLAAGKDGGK